MTDGARADAGRLRDARRIVVLRGGGLGDLVFALPALEALRAAAPGATIRLLVAAWLRELVEHRRAVAGGPVLVDEAVWLPEPVLAHLRTGEPDATGAARALTGDLVAWQPDVAVQLFGGGRHSNPFIAALGARVAVGSRTSDAAPLDGWVPYVHYQSEVFRALEVVGLLGAAPVSVEPRLAVTPADAAETDAAGMGASDPDADTRPLAVIHPGASDPRRHWPTERFAALAARLARAGARVVVVGNAGDGPAARRIADAVPGPLGAASVAGRLSLGGLAGLLARAAVVVGNDSGPVHLARAVGAATVGIYWCGNVVNAGPAWRARHRPAIAWRLACPVCGVDCTAGRCLHDASFVADVGVDEVAGSALELLAAAELREPAPAAGGGVSRRGTGRAQPARRRGGRGCGT